MSGGKPVFVSDMYSPEARMRWGSVQSTALCPMEMTSFSRRFQGLTRAGQVRIASWKDSGPVPHRG